METHTRTYNIQPYVDPTPVDYNDPQAVAECLVDNGDYDGYAFAAAFSEQDVFELALEDANKIIDARRARLQQRRPLQLAQQACARQIKLQLVPIPARRTSVDQRHKIS